MPSNRIDVVGVGSPIVDVIANVSDDFLDRSKFLKGSVSLVEEDEFAALYSNVETSREMAGGTVANTLMGIASFGGRAHFIGKLAIDERGSRFRSELTGAGIDLTSVPSTAHCTGHCLILVTPDGQRTMLTRLGCSIDLGPNDIERDVIERSKITYLEGYLWPSVSARQALFEAATLARMAGRMTAMNLPSPPLVAQYRQSFLEFIASYVDIVFGNQEEVEAFSEEVDFAKAVALCRRYAKVVAVTRGAMGATVMAQQHVWTIDPAPVASIVDTTGAGDFFAAGFLFGIAKGLILPECGRLGAIAAAEVIGYIGARSPTVLSSLIPLDMRHSFGNE